MSSNEVALPSSSLCFHSSAIILLVHRIVNIESESFPQITRSDPVHDFNQDQLPHFSHSDQPLSHIMWVWINDLIVMNLDQIGSGRAVLMYVDGIDADKIRCSFLYSNKPCTTSHNQCVLSNLIWWTGSSSRRVKRVDRNDR